MSNPADSTIGRRAFVVSAAGLAFLPGEVFAMEDAQAMHGLIGRMLAQPGQRDALLAILLEGTGSMPGCLSYVVAKDPVDANALWITEVWDSRASHDASLQLPEVQDAIRRARPLIAGFDHGQETIPVGGVGLAR
jgi:quinol monooxygenase YgiN